MEAAEMNTITTGHSGQIIRFSEKAEQKTVENETINTNVDRLTLSDVTQAPPPVIKFESDDAKPLGVLGKLGQFYWDHQFTIHLLGGALAGVVIGAGLAGLNTSVLVDAGVTGAVAGVISLPFTGETEYGI